MHILLTDILSCPRCGPEFGLILLADRIEARRVLAGTLGCANCRSKYAIRDGVADLRAAPSAAAEAGAQTPEEHVSASRQEPSSSPQPGEARRGGQRRGGQRRGAIGTATAPPSTPPADAALRWAALLGVTEGPGHLLVAGPAAALAGEIASLIEHIEVIAATETPAVGPGAPGVSRIAVRDRLPFYSARVHGVALSGDSADSLLEEGVRVLGRLGRIVLEPAPADAEERIGRAGLHVLARQDRTVVAARVA